MAFSSFEELLKDFNDRELLTPYEKKKLLTSKHKGVLFREEDIAILGQITSDDRLGLLIAYNTKIGWQLWYPNEAQRLFLEEVFIPYIKYTIYKNKMVRFKGTQQLITSFLVEKTENDKEKVLGDTK